MSAGTVVSVNISEQKGTRKHPLQGPVVITDQGMQGDAHAGNWHRQLSLLAQESIDRMQGHGVVLWPGDFAENITTRGLDLLTLPVGTRLQVGASVVLEVTQIGKECHLGCEIRRLVGDCVMPREGIFAVVRQGGVIRVGDEIQIMEGRSTTGAVIGTAESLKVCGGVIREAVLARWAPAFIRIDPLNDGGDNLGQLLDDLSGRQGIDRVIVYDPEGRQALGIAGYLGKAILAAGRTEPSSATAGPRRRLPACDGGTSVQQVVDDLPVLLFDDVPLLFKVLVNSSPSLNSLARKAMPCSFRTI